MCPTREAAKKLARQGLIQITQKGRVVDPDDFKGPIRLRLVDGGLASVPAQGGDPGGVEPVARDEGAVLDAHTVK